MKPYTVNLGEEKLLVFPHDEDREDFLKERPEVDPRSVGIIMLTMFREKGYMDYVEVVEIDEANDEFHTHYSFNKTDWVDWLVGFSLDKERQKELKKTEVILGEFAVKYGWSATLTVEDTPSEWQEEAYILATTKDLRNAKTIPEDWEE